MGRGEFFGPCERGNGETEMSDTTLTKAKQGGIGLPLLVSADDWNPANWVRMPVDDGLDFAIRETAHRRAPTDSSRWTHRVGFAGEVAAASYFGVSANWAITDDYVGDGGHDFQYRDHRIEVKTVTSREDLELAVSTGKVDAAEYFILAQCSRPDELVRLVGYTSRPELKYYGHRFDGELRVGLEYLHPLEPRVLLPDRVREIQEV